MSEVKLSDWLKKIEPKWQDHWERSQEFRAANPGEPGSERPKFYCLDMFPYPSGEGLHVGHPVGYIATDILCRYKRMRGFNVLHPMGWDAFGLPAEQYAIQKGIHPVETTRRNVQNYKRQLKALGFSYDWSREINTTDPGYYKWTQWIFKKLFEKGLAYQAEFAVNWCPALGTVLANDEVVDGKSERGSHPVERRPMRQWVLRITSYAERLLAGLDTLDWPESTKEHQRNWIGKSVGAKLQFRHESNRIEVFTTRPDTLMGVTFLALAPEHPLVSVLPTADRKAAVQAYVEATKNKSDLQRGDLNRDKSGVFTGVYFEHPLSGTKIPVWVADYVLMNYGTGAVMGVPAHDERDREFAESMGLKIVEVISQDGTMLQVPGQESLVGKSTEEGARFFVEKLRAQKIGDWHTSYRLRDWIFARQRYWGEPIPVIHVLEGPEAGALRLLADDELPLELPSVVNYEPSGTGESPLVRVRDWIETQDPKTGARALRESNTMPGSAGSSWYFLRYMDPHNVKQAWSVDAEKYWGPVDLYMGGAEHAVGHLLYSRFWNLFLYDLGLVTHPEPFQKLYHQGLMLGEDGEKMSKSRGNVVNPDQIIAEYGADTLRLFTMFMGPLDKAKPWNTASIEGVYRFLSRFWRLATDSEGRPAAHLKDQPEAEWDPTLVRSLHATTASVQADIEGLRFNTAISSLMILTNTAYDVLAAQGFVPTGWVRRANLLLSPFAPHLSSELNVLLGGAPLASWPSFDPSKVQSDDFELVVQINGKLRDQFRVSVNLGEAQIRELVLQRESVKKWLDGKTPKKVIYVPKKLVSIVI
jgi:leucyl-tRNA synthetase